MRITRWLNQNLSGDDQCRQGKLTTTGLECIAKPAFVEPYQSEMETSDDSAFRIPVKLKLTYIN